MKVGKFAGWTENLEEGYKIFRKDGKFDGWT